MSHESSDPFEACHLENSKFEYDCLTKLEECKTQWEEGKLSSESFCKLLHQWLSEYRSRLENLKNIFQQVNESDETWKDKLQILLLHQQSTEKFFCIAATAMNNAQNQIN